MKTLLTQKYWHKLFEAGIFLKGINGVWEIISGAIVLFFSKATLGIWLFTVTRHELLEDPNDLFTNYLTDTFQNISSNVQIFIAFYLLLHGLINIFLAVQLYRDKHWAYPAVIGFISIFVIYQIYRINLYHSLFLVAITIFDIILIGLVWHEYKYHKDKIKNVAL